MQAQTDRQWTDVAALTPALEGQEVLLRARMHAVRGKGKSAFLVLRQATATVQVRGRPGWVGGTRWPVPPPPGKCGRGAAGSGCSMGLPLTTGAWHCWHLSLPAQAVLFVDDVKVSKGMVKYAAAIPR